MDVGLLLVKHHEITGVGVTLIGNKRAVILLKSLSVLMLSIRFKYWWALYIIRFLEVGVILQRNQAFLIVKK
jgi:hypothetical protein